jgi:fructan beta-fructosidase
MLRRLICLVVLLLRLIVSPAQHIYQERYRPQIHFSPQTGWMNDPNGLIYHEGLYHLFFQYYPDSTVWGPMHWGHAVSKDLLHWKHLPIALYPDSIGYIFSGSAVADNLNTSGFGTDGRIPLIAIYTQHDPAGEKGANNSFQNQSIAYSLDEGKSWTKYSGNPVLRTPGLKDFRDPKVIWYDDQKKWIMVLAAGERVLFYSSADLKTWIRESEFGSQTGAHGGVWECPDLVPFVIDGKKIWLLLASINPGGPQKGSSTQYFTGSFDGHTFNSFDTITRWTDYGPDDYAGVTYGNTGNQHIFLGWMSNWQYGTKLPTQKWRSSMTIPRILGLKKIDSCYYTTMTPIVPDTLERLSDRSKPNPKINYVLHGPSRIVLSFTDLKTFSLVFSNPQGQQLIVGFDRNKNAFYIDRTLAGKSDFDTNFARIYFGPRIATSAKSDISLVIDDSSVELFADEGLTTMTALVFPDQFYNSLKFKGTMTAFETVKITSFASVWEK